MLGAFCLLWLQHSDPAQLDTQLLHRYIASNFCIARLFSSLVKACAFSGIASAMLHPASPHCLCSEMCIVKCASLCKVWHFSTLCCLLLVARQLLAVHHFARQGYVYVLLAAQEVMLATCSSNNFLYQLTATWLDRINVAGSAVTAVAAAFLLSWHCLDISKPTCFNLHRSRKTC